MKNKNKKEGKRKSAFYDFSVQKRRFFLSKIAHRWGILRCKMNKKSGKGINLEKMKNKKKNFGSGDFFWLVGLNGEML